MLDVRVLLLVLFLVGCFGGGVLSHALLLKKCCSVAILLSSVDDRRLNSLMMVSICLSIVSSSALVGWLSDSILWCLLCIFASVCCSSEGLEDGVLLGAAFGVDGLPRARRRCRLRDDLPVPVEKLVCWLLVCGLEAIFDQSGGCDLVLS